MLGFSHYKLVFFPQRSSNVVITLITSATSYTIFSSRYTTPQDVIWLNLGCNIGLTKFNVNSTSNVNVNLMPNNNICWCWYLVFLGCVTKIQHQIGVKYWRQRNFHSVCLSVVMSNVNLNSTVNKFGQFCNELDRWYISMGEQLVIMYLHKEELGMEEGKHICATDYGKCEYRLIYILLIVVRGVTISWASADATVMPCSAWTTLELHSSLKLYISENSFIFWIHLNCIIYSYCSSSIQWKSVFSKSLV